MLAGFIGNFVGFVQELPLLRKTSQCLEYACLFMKTGAVYYFYTRMCVGILNFFTGIVFILKLRQLYNQTDPDIHSHYKSARINKVALIVICLEFFLNFLPQPLALLIFYLSGVTIGSIGGPYSFVLVSLDIFISSMIYSNNIKKAKRNDSVVIVTRSLTQQ
ncbi:serpentine type 7TM GPCR chemoreceptor srbc domain-containing protein [Ditylenchus destructor]|uniref:Serpentine type 7TM GPCR chemoreceptor srbc domain-containing protein n=1 Tax=Ditylenchus destructor TaxID=166010 RepID=A0AAD4MS25_9BILA|nr:serpentine type 7TM GPCR chemoreceptor srbc domain-containing protein [Ditylenchus destructor]